MNNIILKISQEHTLILDYVVRFDKALSDQKFDETALLIRDLATPMKLDLFNHFEMEESILFPAALLGMPTPEVVQLVLELQKEHGSLEKDFQALLNTARKDALFNMAAVELLRPFLEDLKEHARKEIESLFPLINKSPNSIAWILKLAQQV